MALLASRVVAPLSECSSSVRLQGQLTGAAVELFADGTSVGSGIATWSDQMFALTAGATLGPGAQVTAQQTLGTDVSPQSPEPLAVQARPPVVGTVVFRSQVYICGECLWLGGMVPGATFEVRVAGAVRGAGTSHTGEVHVPAQHAHPARRGVRGAADGMRHGRRALAQPGSRRRGNRGGPDAAECPRGGRAAEGVPAIRHRPQPLRGLRVSLARSGGPGGAGCTIAKSQQFGTQPLVLGETVTARQEFAACRLVSPDSAPVVVQSAEPVPPPTVRGPLCSDATSVTLTDLIPGTPPVALQSLGGARGVN